MTSNGSATDGLSPILSSNHAWASQIASSDATYFQNLSKGQSPGILWIGCSDSRCPETTILGLKPGDVFTHRNIANVVSHTDLSSLAVIEFAVNNLKVQHVIVCGHTSCGGIAASLGNKHIGKIDSWLMPIRQIRHQNAELLDSLPEGERAGKMSELNVRQSVEVVRQNPDVIAAARDRGLQVHGMIFDLSTGELKRLETEEDKSAIVKRSAAFECS